MMIRCCGRRVAIAQDEHATCRLRSAVALPSRAGREQSRTAASVDAASAPRSRVTSTSCAARTLQSLSQAELAEGSAARQHQVPPPACDDRARRALTCRPRSAADLPSRAGGGPRDSDWPADGDWADPRGPELGSRPGLRRLLRCGNYAADPADSVDRWNAGRDERLPPPPPPPPLCGRACGLTREVGWPSGSPRFAGRLRQGWAWAGATSPPWRPPPHYTRLRHVCSSEPACFPLCPQGNCPRCCPFGPALKRTLRVAACQID